MDTIKVQQTGSTMRRHPRPRSSFEPDQLQAHRFRL